MIGNSPIDYVAIRCSIAGLRAVAPASIGYLVLSVWQRRWFYKPLTLYAALEAAFYLLVYLPRRKRLQAPPERPAPQLTAAQRQALFQRCLEAERHGISTTLPYPRGWFLPNSTMPKREDVVDWLLWALFATSRELIDITEYQEELDGYIECVEGLLGGRLEPGCSDPKDFRSMRITLDPVVMLHRPLLWYFIVAMVDTYTSIFLTYLGFKHYSPKILEWRLTFPPRPVLFLLSRDAPDDVVTPYWYRQHKSDTEHPLVFLHGIGIGLYPYIPFLSSIISTNPDVGILLPEVMPICMHMTPKSVPPRQEMLASLNTILESLYTQEQAQLSRHLRNAETPLLNEQRTLQCGWDKVVFSAHSYGTFIAGWIIRECASAHGTKASKRNGLVSKIKHIVLVDPIPILLSNPTVAHNFLYREPTTVCPRKLGSVTDVQVNQRNVKAMWYSAPAAWQLWYFASRDADIAYTLFRSFFWSEGGIFREDIDAWLEGAGVEGRNFALFLGGMDQIVPSEAIRKYLTGEPEWSTHWCGANTYKTPSCPEQDTGNRTTFTSFSPSSTLAECSSRGPRKLEVVFHPSLDHAVIFDRPKSTASLTEVIRRYLRE